MCAFILLLNHVLHKVFWCYLSASTKLIRLTRASLYHTHNPMKENCFWAIMYIVYRTNTNCDALWCILRLLLLHSTLVIINHIVLNKKHGVICEQILTWLTNWFTTSHPSQLQLSLMWSDCYRVRARYPLYSACIHKQCSPNEERWCRCMRSSRKD